MDSSEVACSSPSFPEIREEKKGFSHVQESVHLNRLKATMRAMYRIIVQVTPIPKKSHWILGAYLIRVPDIILSSGGECGGKKTSLEGNNSSSICYTTFLV